MPKTTVMWKYTRAVVSLVIPVVVNGLISLYENGYICRFRKKPKYRHSISNASRFYFNMLRCRGHTSVRCFLCICEDNCCDNLYFLYIMQKSITWCNCVHGFQWVFFSYMYLITCFNSKLRCHLWEPDCCVLCHYFVPTCPVFFFPSELINWIVTPAYSWLTGLQNSLSWLLSPSCWPHLGKPLFSERDLRLWLFPVELGLKCHLIVLWLLSKKSVSPGLSYAVVVCLI